MGSTAKPYLIRWDLEIGNPSEAEGVKRKFNYALAGDYTLVTPGAELKLEPPAGVEVINSRFTLEKAAMASRREFVLP